MTLKTLGPFPLESAAEVAAYILNNGLPHIVAFSGDLGAGKTTLVRELMSMMGATGEVNSPTFGIINEYRTRDNRKVCHTDWYRIKDAAELMDTGIQEYLDDPDCLVLIEWPEVGQSLLTGEEVLFVEIEHAGEQRIYHLNLRH